LAQVVHLIQDMLFASKVREVAKQIGVTVQATRDPAALAAAAREAKLVIVDLRLPRALEALDALAADAATRDVIKVGFIDHEKTDVMEAARARGCTEVMAKGQFANALPRLFAGLQS
jgi:CheY-like chemotaxis protein